MARPKPMSMQHQTATDRSARNAAGGAMRGPHRLDRRQLGGPRLDGDRGVDDS
jgi:hypothetical protein